MHPLAALLVLPAAVGPLRASAARHVARGSDATVSGCALHPREARKGAFRNRPSGPSRARAGEAEGGNDQQLARRYDRAGDRSVIDVGGFLGIGGKEIAIAFEA